MSDQKSCTVHETPCPTTCRGRPENQETPPPPPTELEPATKVPGPLCGICKAMLERRIGPVDVETTVTSAGCRHCTAQAEAIRKAHQRAERQTQLLAEAMRRKS